MTYLSIDLETYSSVDLTKCGVHRYTEADDFEILLFGFAFNDDPVQVIDLAGGERIPDEVVKALTDPTIIKTAYNAAFERVCLEAYFRRPMPAKQWQCTMVHALYLGLPGGLDDVAKSLKLAAQKDAAGKALIRYFSVPCKPTKSNGGRTRNLPKHDPNKWKRFKAYCAQDVEVERALRKKLARYPMPDREWELWMLDQEINDRGVRIDEQFVQRALECDRRLQTRLTKKAKKLTGLQNPKSVAQLKVWLEEREGWRIESLDKEALPELIERAEKPETKRMLELRREMAKTSVKKYEAMERVQCTDTRARGLLQFYGANRSGRWCLTGDHEVLTPDGWVRMDEWSGGYIACWSPQTEFISFQRAAALSFDYEGDLYAIESQRCSQLSTPDHRMAYWGKFGWEVDTIEHLTSRRFSIPFTGHRVVRTSLEHTELRVLIMTQADGHYTQEGDLRFHFSKQRKIQRCKNLLRKCGLVFTVMERPTATVITIKSRHLPLWLRSFRDKTFGMWLLDESADVIFDELEHWDAYRCGPNSLQYTTTNKQNADVIQALAHLSGRAATIVTKIRKEDRWSNAYIVNIWLTPGGKNEIRNKPTKTPFKGKVFCAETNTGFFLVRRNGKVWVTGNSGRLIQVQNLPRNELPDLETARGLLRDGYYDMLELLYDSVPDTLSQLIRTAFIPSPGHRFIVADFSAIEARVIAWLADEEWRLKVFRTHGKIYEASASAMFHVPIEEVTKGSPLRQKGKIAELALGYSGGKNALIKMGALKMGLSEEELPGLVDAWRRANPKIVQFWYDMEAAAIDALRRKAAAEIHHGIAFEHEPGVLFMRLPSGRRLAYVSPRLERDEQFGRLGITYEGNDQGAWGRVRTYSGKLVENCVQAIARDCLAEALLRLDAVGYRVVFHVHDEVILDVPHGFGSVEEVTEIMGRPINWAPGLPLRADGYECSFYRKD